MEDNAKTCLRRHFLRYYMWGGRKNILHVKTMLGFLLHAWLERLICIHTHIIIYDLRQLIELSIQTSKLITLSFIGISSAEQKVSLVTQLCPTLCDPMNCSMPSLSVHHQLLEFTQTHVHRVSDAIQPSHPLLSPSPPAPNPSQHQGLFQ